jgi:rhamnose utilization protein RhaD (predicted bifunctional aldolase and dehydrogenase)
VTTVWDPTLTSPQLEQLTRSLGDPAKDLVILAEGNTSQRLDDDRIVVKASGANLATCTAADFVVVSVSEVMALVLSEEATQADLTRVLDAGVHEGRQRRGSIEALIHAAVQSVAPAEFVAHTHPTDVIAILASVHAETEFDRAVYSDEAVVVGRPLFVPYAQPGLDLGRVFHQRLVERFEEDGVLPSLILLGNHGILTIAETPEGAEAISLMAVKSARVRLRAHAAGGTAPLTHEAVAKYVARDDISERRQHISGTAGRGA